MRAQVVDDVPLFPSIYHVRVKTPGTSRLETANPTDRLAPDRVDISIVLHAERHLASLLREHDAPPRAKIEKRQRIERAMPNAFHHAAPDRGNGVAAAKAEAALDLGVQAAKIRAQCLLKDGC